MSLSIWQNLPPSITALLYPAYKDNIQTRGGLDQVCATRMYRSIERVEFPKSLKLYTMHNNSNKY